MRSFSTSAASFSHFSSRVWGISPSIGRPTTEAPLEWASAVTSSNRSVSVAELRMSGVPAAACTAWAITAGSAVSIMMPQEECSRMSATTQSIAASSSPPQIAVLTSRYSAPASACA